MKNGYIFLIALTAAACSKPVSESIQPAAGCGEGATGIVVSDAWVRAADTTRPATAAYLTLCNAGSEPDVLVGATSPAAQAVELHQTVRADDGVTRMSPVAHVELDPSTPVMFAPGGAHIMMIGLNESLEAGATASLTLQFEHGPAIAVEAPVREAAPGAEQHH